jgi:chromosome partitioning protein
VSEDALQRLLERFKIIAQGDIAAPIKMGEIAAPINGPRFSRYAISNFRGGIGKSTIAFNLAWEVSRTSNTLLLDVCPQRNLTQSLLGEDIFSVNKTIYDLLLSEIFSGVEEVDADEILISVAPHCTSFKSGRKCYVMPGSSDLFLFPSTLYSQLAAVSQIQGANRARDFSNSILRSVERIIEHASKDVKPEKVIIDTSPFFGGATHLAWVACEALIVPVRVDQHSIEALRLTLSMLKDSERDFLRLNKQAGIDWAPKVHAIAVTHCGWNRQSPNTPDHSTQSYVKSIIDICMEYKDLFSHEDVVDSIHLLDDFHSAGRISGTRRIPLSQLHQGDQFIISGQRLEVNQSIARYQTEMRSLAQII